MAAEPQKKRAKFEVVEAELSQQRQKTKIEFDVFRVRKIRDNPGFLKQECHGVAYWMNRDQRVQDNWAMLYAQKLALQERLPLHVVFCLAPKVLQPTLRHCTFMLEGLKEVQQELKSLDIPFHVLSCQAPNEVLPDFMRDFQVGCLVTDMNPLRLPRKWLDDVEKATDPKTCLYQVDAHNVVPIWNASDKQEYAARTIRGKLTKKLDRYLTEFPAVTQHPHEAKVKAKKIDWEKLYEQLDVDESVGPVDSFTPGYRAGIENIDNFARNRIKLYADKRNNPTVKEALSNIAPWLHFGQVSAQRAILYVKRHGRNKEGVDAFVEEALIRRELADNFCYFQPDYDNLNGTYEWARHTLEIHAKDKRQYLYTKKELESARTHDDLWNAAQIQLVTEGKMHGFLRMYWAKKILEWTQSPTEALSISLYLNDKYSLDGTDPNGFVGCMWSVAGVHDQGWKEREVYGKIRCMTYDGCKRKFDVPTFVGRYEAKAYPYKKK